MTITPTQTDIGSFWEGLSTLEMVEEVQGWLGVSDYNRYPKAKIISALNMGQARFTKLTGCLLMPAIIIGKAQQMHYRVPFNTLRILTARYYTSSDATGYKDLALMRDMRQIQRLDSVMRGNYGDPERLFPTYRAGNILTFGLNPIPAIDGAVFSGTPYGVLTTATGYTTAGKITGAHKAGYDNSAFLVDSLGRDLTTLGALVGYPVFNTTKGVSAVITAIGDQDATNDKVSGTLSGSGDWDENDAFEIPMNEYGVVVEASGQETYTIGTSLGTIGDIVAGAGNLALDLVRAPLALSIDLDTMVSEIPASYQEAPIAFAVYWLGRGAYKGLVQAEKAKEAEARFLALVGEYLSEPQLVETSEDCVEDQMGRFLE